MGLAKKVGKTVIGVDKNLLSFQIVAWPLRRITHAPGEFLPMRIRTHVEIYEGSQNVTEGSLLAR